MSEGKPLTRDEVLQALRTPSGRGERHIYEAGDRKGRASGHFYMTYAAFNGGTANEVPRSVINELEREGVICRRYPDKPEIACWMLVSGGNL